MSVSDGQRLYSPDDYKNKVYPAQKQNARAAHADIKRQSPCFIRLDKAWDNWFGDAITEGDLYD